MYKGLSILYRKIKHLLSLPIQQYPGIFGGDFRIGNPVTSEADIRILELLIIIIQNGFDKFDDYFPQLRLTNINLEFYNPTHSPGFFDHIQNDSLLRMAARIGQPGLVQKILQWGGTVNIPEAYTKIMFVEDSYPGTGKTALIFASENGHLECMQLLVEHSDPAVINFRTDNWDDTTALHEAAKNGHNECVRYLLEHGASTSIWNGCRETPLEVSKNDECRIIIKEKMLQRNEYIPRMCCIL